MTEGLTRRRLLGGTAALGAAAALPAVAPAPAYALPGWPTFTYLREAVDRDTLRYNPTNELIFPSIRGTAGRVANPLGAYYLYYAPHDPPGGICVAYSDSLVGPFTEYRNNPVIANSWPPHYANLSHVSSPHVLWNESNSTFYMYYHGENWQTRLARSRDGLTWTYDRVILTTDDLPSNVYQTSYARTFRHTVPAKNNTYTMLFMGEQAGTRKIFWAWSNDQRTWSVQQTPLVSPAGDGEAQIGNPCLVLKNGVPHVVYNSPTKVYVTRVGTNFTEETHLGVFHTPRSTFPDYGRVSSVVFAQSGGTVYMYYEAGPRLEGRIAVATAPAVSGVTWPQ